MSDSAGKNLWLLGQESPPWRQLDIHEEIAALKQELAKGEAIYAATELRYMARKLAEREEVLRVLTTGG